MSLTMWLSDGGDYILIAADIEGGTPCVAIPNKPDNILEWIKAFAQCEGETDFEASNAR